MHFLTYASIHPLRGFAFVVFEDAEAVQHVMDEVPHTIDGRQVDAKKAIPHAIHQVGVVRGQFCILMALVLLGYEEQNEEDICGGRAHRHA